MIRLPKKQWKHIASDHSILANKIYEIQETIVNPLVIMPSVYNEYVREYYRYEKEVKEYLMVVVRYLNGTGFIITSNYVKRIKT